VRHVHRVVPDDGRVEAAGDTGINRQL
jgi:hypothetical protein